MKELKEKHEHKKFKVLANEEKIKDCKTKLTWNFVKFKKKKVKVSQPWQSKIRSQIDLVYTDSIFICIYFLAQGG